MSSLSEFSYELEREQRRRVYLNQIRATTEQFYNRYMNQYRQMQQNGAAAYIPSEMSRLESDLSRIRSLLSSDPEAARELSYDVGYYISSMSSLAHAAREEFDRAERMRIENLRVEREKKQNELTQRYFEIIQSMKNPIVVNYSIAAMQELRKEIENGIITNKVQLEKKAAEIQASAEERAGEWKENTMKKNRKKDISAVIDEAEQRLQKETIENQEKTQEFLNKINRLRSNLEQDNMDADAVEQQIVELEKEVDDTLISEETRRETVKAIMKQLKSQEFTVEPPQLITSDGKNYVKIVAKQPSGKRAVCNVDLHGKLAYKFDNYEGMTCLKDIEKFNVDLEKVYSIKLSDERVLWQNPDKLSMDANRIPVTDGRNA